MRNCKTLPFRTRNILRLHNWKFTELDYQARDYQWRIQRKKKSRLSATLPFFLRPTENVKIECVAGIGWTAGACIWLIKWPRKSALSDESGLYPLSVISTTRAETTNQPGGRLSTSRTQLGNDYRKWRQRRQRVLLTFHRTFSKQLSRNSRTDNIAHDWLSARGAVSVVPPPVKSELRGKKKNVRVKWKNVTQSF